MKLAAMLRIVRAMQFVLDKLAALLRGRGSDELLADEFLDEASRITRSALFNMPLFYNRPATTRLQFRKRTSPPENS
jgi:hypothetical protein